MPLPLDDQQRDRWVSLLGRFNLRLVVQQWETERVSSRLQGSSRRSGRFPALPYPPLEQMGCSESSIVARGVLPVSVSLGPIDGERETAGDCRGRLSR